MTETRKTVVIISPAFPENESATYWVPSQQLLVKALKENFPRYNFEVLALLYPYEKKEYRWHDIRVTSYHGTSYPGLKRLSLWYAAWKKLKRVRRKKNLVGILSFWCMEAALVGSWFARWHKLPHYCWLCGQDARKTNRYIKLIRPRSQELVAISDFVASKFYRNHKVKPGYIIPNALDEKMFPPTVPADRDIDIMGVGALIPLKQFDKMIKVVAMLKKFFPDIRVKIVGIGDERKKLDALIQQLGLQNNIEMMGALGHEQVLDLLQRTKLLLHPSGYEGFSTVCLEALFAGARVISFVQPMNYDIKNWSIVHSSEDMFQLSLEILQKPFIPERVRTWSMDEIAKKMMHLFDPKA